jgi:hypothetical protein
MRAPVREDSTAAITQIQHIECTGKQAIESIKCILTGKLERAAP